MCVLVWDGYDEVCFGWEEMLWKVVSVYDYGCCGVMLVLCIGYVVWFC